MNNFRPPIFVLTALIAMAGLYFFEQRKRSVMVDDNYIKTINEFRMKQEAHLKSPNGWLTVVGLHWLKAGEQTLGSGTGVDIQLPTPVTAKLGTVTLKGESARLRLADAKNVFVNGQPAKLFEEIDLHDDTTKSPTEIKIGGVTFFALKRKNGIGLRVRDENSEPRKNFLGRQWYPVNNDFLIEGEWVAHEQPKTLLVPDIIGNVNEKTSTGFVRFELNGKKLELHPTEEDGKLFYVFRDMTAGKETYGAARFLVSEKALDGKVILDFNKSVNPPCAFTPFATCPMPPKENILQAAIAAGELKPMGSDH